MDDQAMNGHAETETECSEPVEYGEEVGFQFLPPPTHLRSVEDVVEWIEGDVTELIYMASQLAHPPGYRTVRVDEEVPLPADPRLMDALLTEMFRVTVTLADVLQGRRVPEDLQSRRVTNGAFARLLAESERIGLEERGLAMLVRMARAAVDAESVAKRHQDRRRALNAMAASAAAAVA